MENTLIFEATESFSVPAAIVDKHIQAPQNALRLILFLLRNRNTAFLTEEICKQLSFTQEELEDSFEYWERAGILFKYGGRYRLERPKVQPTDIIRYAPSAVAERMDTDPAIAYLYKKTEQAFARPLTADDAAAILSITDWIGLKPEVAALLIEYVTARGAKSIRKLLSTAAEWEELGLDSFEKADEYVTEQNKKQAAENRVASLLGISGRRITQNESALFIKWSEEFGFDKTMILEAYDRTVKNTGKFTITYMDKILTSWNEGGYKTPADIPTDVATKSKPTTQRKTKVDAMAAEAASWDIIEKALEDGSDE